MEATMWGGTTTRTQLEKSISSLYAVHKVPEAPTESRTEPGNDPTRRLSFKREKEIASHLAFLSATSDDTRKVMAVCVEEQNDGEGITIRLASNSGDPSVVRDGFKRIGEILEIAARRRNPEIQDIEALLRQVIILDMDRILSRLRSRHMRTLKTAGKPALITQLNNAINDESVRSTAILTNKSQHLQDLFTELEGISDIGVSPSPAHRIIYEIVTQAYALTSTTKLDLLLSDSKLEPPSLRSHIPLALGKLSRYHYAAYSLVRAARSKKYHLFHKVHVESFSISMPPALDKAIKVHAEIQLLFFYEAHANLPRPRIICASKSACYLCNLFFRFHGVFHAPRSHGKLYTQWILPDWLAIPPSRHAEFGDITTQLNKALETRLQSRTNGHPDPHESVISIPRDWTPSTTSKVTSVASTSTIRPQSSRHPGASSQLQGDPLTPPQTPVTQIPSSALPPLPVSAVESARTPRRTRHVSITSSRLPYSQLIDAATPPLCLHLDDPRLSLEFDFSHASPCQLQLSRRNERERTGGDHRTIYIQDIPTATEMDITCSRHGPRELKFQLRSGDRGGLCVAVVWGVS